MNITGQLLAWVEERYPGGVVGAYLGCAGTSDDMPIARAPALQVFESVEAARLWVLSEASVLQVSVRWLDHAPAA